MIRTANSLGPHTASNAPWVRTMFKETNLFDATQRSAQQPRQKPDPDPEPNPEPNPEPDSALHAGHFEISPADWDTLFHAVIERLQTCAGHAPLAQIPEHALGESPSVQATLHECVLSMKWLHVALQSERDLHKPQH